MDWDIIAIITALGGSGGLLSWYNAKTNRDSIAIKNVREVIDEMKEHHCEYRAFTESKFEKLEKKISALELKNDMNKNIIHQSYACRLPPAGGKCPVVEANDKLCSLLKEELDKD